MTDSTDKQDVHIFLFQLCDCSQVRGPTVFHIKPVIAAVVLLIIFQQRSPLQLCTMREILLVGTSCVLRYVNKLNKF